MEHPISVRGEGVDQFGQVLLNQPTITLSTVTTPANANASLSSSGSTNTIAFNRAGNYSFKLQSGNLQSSFSVVVSQRFASIALTPGTASVAYGAKQLFTAVGQDQFQNALTTQPSFTWTASTGTITSAGLYTASSTAGQFTITVKSGTITATSTVTITPPPAPTDFQKTEIKNLVQSLYGDGSLNRLDVISILRSVGTDGTVDGAELGDLQYLVSNATQFNIPSYVQVLASNIVSGNVANRYFKGQTAGNIVAGSTSTLLNNLVDKWFLGADAPSLTNASISYRIAAGVLFNGTPSRADERQGQLGDCYFIASLGSIADRNPTAISNMFIDNGDGTFTVRFYGGTYGYNYASNGTATDGFTTGSGVADYVTVDRRLPTYANGMFAYSGYGLNVSSTTAPLWIALAEKAYAQWNETGKSGRNGTNTYSAIEGGWMSTVNAQVVGTNSSTYMFSNTPKQTLVDALNSNKSVTLGTKSSVGNGLVGGHAYTITGYNSSTDTFSVYNPWGSTHPAPLTWAQLQANCTAFIVFSSSGSTPIVASGAVRSNVADAFGVWSTESSNAQSDRLHAFVTTVQADGYDEETILQLNIDAPTDNNAADSTGVTFTANDEGSEVISIETAEVIADKIFASLDLLDLLFQAHDELAIS